MKSRPVEHLLVQAEEHVATARMNVTRQREVVGTLRRVGHGAKAAIELLEEYEQVLALQVQVQDRLIRHRRQAAALLDKRQHRALPRATPQNGSGEATTPETLPAPGEFMPLDLEQFRRGFMLFLCILSGQVPAPPPPETYRDADTGHEQPVKDTTFNRAWIAAGRLFKDEGVRSNFYWRLELFGFLAKKLNYQKYIGFVRPSLHLAFVAALARCQFSKGMSEKACIAAFDEELRRQLGSPVRNRTDNA